MAGVVSGAKLQLVEICRDGAWLPGAGLPGEAGVVTGGQEGRSSVSAGQPVRVHLVVRRREKSQT